MLESCRLPTSLQALLLLVHLPLFSALVPYKEIISSKTSPNTLPWHRLSECPSDIDNFQSNANCRKRTVNGRETYRCTDFTQYCFDRSMSVTCGSYSRECDSVNNCEEKYNDCRTKLADTTKLVKKATGDPAKVYAECIPAIDALRDQCDSNFTCSSRFSFNPKTDELDSCRIECTKFDMKCYNYTRNCTEEISEVMNTLSEQKVKIESSECEYLTWERKDDLKMFYNRTVIAVSDEGVETVQGAVLIETIDYDNWTMDEAWESCWDATYVPYQPMCNQFIRHMMVPLRDVVYEPRAHDLIEGIKKFLSLWDDGYKVLCDVKYNCFVQLIKFSRACWPGLPLQRFLPGADYASVEDLLKNMTRIACRDTPPPPVKFEGDDSYLNAKNSCASFFDVESPITKPLYDKFTINCAGPDQCSQKCNETLNGYSERFGCCLGSIVFEYDVHQAWYRLFNFANNDVLRKLKECNTTIGARCEDIVPTSIVVVVVRNFLYILGGIMALVVVAMTVSFYWQLEHEPIKKAFYHF